MWRPPRTHAGALRLQAMELGKRQGYEVPFSTTAGGGGLLALLQKKNDVAVGDDDAAAAGAVTTTAPNVVEGPKK